MATYASTILSWADIDADALTDIERAADAAHVPGMHDERVDIIVANAFNGMGDATGSDDFGYSVAWIDLADHIDTQGFTTPDPVTYQNVGAYLATWRDVSGCRYALAYIDSNGSRSAVGYATRTDMMDAYRAIEAEYLSWDDSSDF